MDDLKTADPTPGNDIDVVQEAKEYLPMVADWERDIREEADRCNSFRALDQWDPLQRLSRGESRPSLVLDQTEQYASQVVNRWKRNRLGVKVSAGDGGDPKAAKIIDGHIREIEYCSMAHLAYDNAFDQMVGSGRGFFGVTTRRRQGSREQDIYVRQIPNAASVYMDPFCQEPDYSDMRRCLIVSRMGWKQFRDAYPGAAKMDFQSMTMPDPLWATRESVQVAEWWVAREKKRRILMLSKPMSIYREEAIVETDTPYLDEFARDMDEARAITQGYGIDIQDDDDDIFLEVWQYMVNGVEELSRTRWLGYCIPIVPMVGKKVFYKNKLKVFSLLSRLLDAQRVFNYSQSSMAERLGQFCRTPVIGAVGQFKTMAEQWATINVKALPYLEYDMIGPADRPLPPPARTDFDPHIDQMIQASMVAKENMRGNAGMYQPSLGESETRARSGVAVRELKSGGDNATYDFPENGAIAIEIGGRIMVDLIPKIKAQSKQIRTRDVHGEVSILPTPRFPGKYTAVVTAAPSHETMRKEAAEFTMDIYKMLPPEVQPKAAAVMLRYQDTAGAAEMADAIDPQPPKGPLDPEVQRMMDEMKKIIEHQTLAINALNEEREKKTLELDNKLQVAQIQADAQIRSALVKTGSEEQIAEADRFADSLEGHKDRAHEAAMGAAEAKEEPNEPAE